SRRQHGARTSPGAAGSTSAEQGESGPPVPAPPSLPIKPVQMTGQPLPHDASLRLLLGGYRPAWLSVTTGRTEPIRGLPRPGNGYQPTRLPGGRPPHPFPGNPPNCANCAPRPPPVSYVADGSRAASRIGAADYTAPTTSPGLVWLVSYQPGADMSAAAGT